MRKLLFTLLALLACGLAPEARAQTPVALNCYAGPTLPLWAPCNSTLPLQVQIAGGGGGGLSVVDQTAWVQGTSPFTPTGCVFNDTATLSSGQEGTVRCTTDRQFKVLDSATLAAIQSPIPDCGATPCTNKIGVVGVNTWAAGVLGAMANYGTSPGLVLVPGVNASVTNFGTGTAGAAAGGVVTVQGVASMTKLLVTPDSVALPANQSVNVAQFGGVATTTGQVAVSTAPVTATNTALVVDLRPDSPGIIALGQTTKSASVPVTIASDQYVDPCQSPNIAKSSAPIAITTATTTSLVAVSGSTTVYVCGFSFSASQVITTANALTFEYGTGAACTSPTVLTGPYGTGGITAGPPVHYSAGNAGQTIFKSAASNGICALTTIGATAAFEGFISYVQQ